MNDARRFQLVLTKCENQISQANAQLTQYYTRYESRLKAKNKSYIQKILFVMKQLIKCLAPTETSVSASHSEGALTHIH
jgi:hypothetical protein